MGRVFFQEKQKLPDSLRWIIPMGGLVLCFPLLRGIYIRTILHEPWGKPSFDDGELWLITAFLMLVIFSVAWFLSIIFLEVKMDETAIYYRFYPNQRKFKSIEKQTIETYVIRKLTWTELSQSQESGKSKAASEEQVVALRGKLGLVLTLQGGRKLILGTQNMDGIIWALRKLMSNS